MPALKVSTYPGLTRVAPAAIESHETEQGLRDATFTFEIQLHDLRSKFLMREGKLRDDYLSKVQAITSG